MSSSFRSVTPLGALGWVTITHVMFACSAIAQEVAFVPQANISTEWATNRNLTIPAGPDSELYRTTVGADLLRRTSVSDLDFRPLITMQHDAQISTLDTLEALVDLAGDY